MKKYSFGIVTANTNRFILFFILFLILLCGSFKPNWLVTPENKAMSTCELQSPAADVSSLYHELSQMLPQFSNKLDFKKNVHSFLGRQGWREAARTQKYIINVQGFMKRASRGLKRIRSDIRQIKDTQNLHCRGLDRAGFPPVMRSAGGGEMVLMYLMSQ